jgi:hypothetical protein
MRRLRPTASSRAPRPAVPPRLTSERPCCHVDARKEAHECSLVRRFVRPTPAGQSEADADRYKFARTRNGSATEKRRPAPAGGAYSGRCGQRRHPEVAARPKRRVRAKVLPRQRHMPGVICRVTEAVSCDRFPPPIFVRDAADHARTDRRHARVATRSNRGQPARLPRVAAAGHAQYRQPPCAAGGSRPPHPGRWVARARHTAREATQRPPGRSATRGDCGSGTRWPAAPRHSRLTEARADPRLTMQPPAADSAQSAQAGARPHIPGARAACREQPSAAAESGTAGGESPDAHQMVARGTFHATDAFG